MKKHYRHENDCLNCGTILQGKFCYNCGQENLQIKENFGHLMNHAISDYFHFDHQFFHTLKPLLFQPGKLTNEYMAGKRVQYLHPVKMYIFISLIFFVLFFKKTRDDVVNYDKGKANKEVIDSVRKSIANNPQLSKGVKDKLDKDLVSQTSSAKNTLSADEDENVDPDMLISYGKYKSYEEYIAAQQKLPENKRDGFFKRLVEQKKFEYNKEGKNAKEEVAEEIKHNVPKMMFVLLPLFAVILRFTFWNSKKFYVEHLIFSFHLHCFIFLLLTISMLIELVMPHAVNEWIDLLVMIGIIIYTYKALNAVYHTSRARTITKMIGMSFSYTIVFTICMVIVVVISTLMAI